MPTAHDPGWNFTSLPMASLPTFSLFHESAEQHITRAAERSVRAQVNCCVSWSCKDARTPLCVMYYVKTQDKKKAAELHSAEEKQ